MSRNQDLWTGVRFKDFGKVERNHVIKDFQSQRVLIANSGDNRDLLQFIKW